MSTKNNSNGNVPEKISNQDKLASTESNTHLPFRPINKCIEILSIRRLSSPCPVMKNNNPSKISSIEERGLSTSINNTLLWTQILAAFACAFCQVANGGMFSYPGIALPLLMDEKSDDIILNTAQASLFTSLINIGNLVGCIFAGVLMTWFGQRRCLIFVLPIGMFGWTLLGLAPSYGVLLASRITLGLVTGLVTSNSYNYVVELAHPAVRGRLVALADLLRQVSFTVTMAIGSFNLTWRQQAFIQIAPIIVPFVILISLPDSPRWLAMKSRMEEAHKSLRFFRGEKYDTKKELHEISEQISHTTKSLSIRSQLKLMKSPKILPIFIVVGFLMFCIHWGGNSVVATYSIVIFRSANVPVDPYMSSIVSAAFRIFGCATFIMVANRFNRKPLFCLGLTLSGVAMIVLGFFFYFQLGHDVSGISWLPLVCLSVFNYFTSLYFPIFMLLRGELIPNSVRSLGSGILFCLLGLDGFLVTFTYPYLAKYLGSHWTFWMYGISGFVMALIVWIFIPETKGKTLEEIGDMQIRRKQKSKETDNKA